MKEKILFFIKKIFNLRKIFSTILLLSILKVKFSVTETLKIILQGIVYYAFREMKMPPSQGAYPVFFNKRLNNARFRTYKAGWMLLCFQAGEQVTGRKRILLFPVMILFSCFALPFENSNIQLAFQAWKCAFLGNVFHTTFFHREIKKWIFLPHRALKSAFFHPLVEQIFVKIITMFEDFLDVFEIGNSRDVENIFPEK